MNGSFEGALIFDQPDGLLSPCSPASPSVVGRKRPSVGGSDDLNEPGYTNVGEAKRARMQSSSLFATGHSDAVLALSRMANFGSFDDPPSVSPAPPLPSFIEDWLSTFSSWTHEHRIAGLDAIIPLCDSVQLKCLMEQIQPQFQRDFISILPKELALHVLRFLAPRDLLVAAQTCRTWHTLCEDCLLWREKCRECGVGESGLRASRAILSNPWKQMYLTKHRVDHNWRRLEINPPHRLKTLKSHDDHVVTCLQFSGNRVVSGSDDNTLSVWHAITGKHLRQLTGHTGGVWCSQFDGSTVVSGSTDRTLRVWDSESGESKHVLHGHTSTVRCIALQGNVVVSGSRDSTLRVWNIESGECTQTLLGHVAAVRCVQFDGHRVVSGAYDYLVKVWDPVEGACLHTLTGHTNRVYSLQFDGVHIVSGSLDTHIRVWNANTGQCLHTLKGHQSLTSGMMLRKNILVSGNADSTVKVWDITTGQCLHTLQGPHKHLSAVTSLQFTDNFVVTSSDDGTVKLWDLKTGEFIRNLVQLDSGGNGGVVWRVKCSERKLVCAVGSRNGIEDTKLLVLDFDDYQSMLY
ncbi:F-box/WD repeat-containing protein 7-like [Halichondria panicea]|uniref:F-box/WD repeat-containing protein 7-like n=1 Tax=Halichondria panicea TaxID=6063 RepID=UPI00312B2DDE